MRRKVALEFATGKLWGSAAHRRRIKKEEKAKVVATVWGTELIQFLVVLAIFHKDDLKKWMYSSYSSNHSG